MFQIRLKLLRENANLSQSNLAKHLGTSQGAVGNWESGIRQPNLDMLAKLSDFFGVSVDFLLGRDDEQTKKEIAALSDDDLNFEIIKLLSDFTPETRDLALQILRTLKDHEE